MKEVTREMGQVGMVPKGAYDPNTTYKVLETVLYDHDTWTSLDNGNKGHTPADGSNWWQRQTDGGKHAYEEGENAKTQAGFANSKGNEANLMAEAARTQAQQAQQKAEQANTQANRAKQFADHPPYVGSDNFWYFWDETTSLYVKSSAYAKGDSLDWDSMTQEDKENVIRQAAEKALEEMVVENVSDETITGWIDNA